MNIGSESSNYSRDQTRQLHQFLTATEPNKDRKKTWMKIAKTEAVTGESDGRNLKANQSILDKSNFSAIERSFDDSN